MNSAPFTHSQITEMFGYDSNTGNLMWKICPSTRIKIGDIAGSVASNGRRYISIDGKRLLAHRVVWYHQKSLWPTLNVVQRNGDYLDTRIENLVEETQSKTSSKSSIRNTNKSGVKGVSWNSIKKVWMVHAYRNYQTVFLGQFKELEDAVKCKRNANVGVFLDENGKSVANKESKRTGAQMRRLWTKMIKSSGGIHGWNSMQEFYQDIGNQPQTNFSLVKINKENPIGPNNFKWGAPEFDFRTREGRIAAGKVWKSDNYEQIRAGWLNRKFGISPQDYEKKLEEQSGVCDVCGNPETNVRKGKLLPLSVDHCHKSGKVRGLLCHQCNTGIGKFRDNKELLYKAIKYLDKWDAVESTPKSHQSKPIE